MKKRMDDMDELLRRVMPDVNEKMIEEWQKGVDSNYAFLGEDEKKLRKLLRKSKDSDKRKKIVKRILKVAATIAIVVTVVANNSMTAIAERRINFYASKCHIYGIEMTEFRYKVENDNVKFIVYEPGYIPEGYKETKREEISNQINIKYTNENGDYIIWQQLLITEDITFAMDAEHDSEVIIPIGRDEIHIYTKGDIKFAYHESMDYVFFITASDLTDEEFRKMVDEK